LSKLSRLLSPSSAVAFEFSIAAPKSIDRLFLVPYGNGAGGTVFPPSPIVEIVAPDGSILAPFSNGSGVLDVRNVALPVAGTYRVFVRDTAGLGGAYKGTIVLPN
jgi:hypothetical protein